MKVTTIVSDILNSNVYIVEKGNECLIIDSGAYLEDVKKVVGDKKVVAVLLTHGHFDHSRFCNEYANYYNCKIFASEQIKLTLSDYEANYSEERVAITDFSRFNFIGQDQTITLGEFEIDCFYCPGHSICSECYKINDILFAGDVLFEKSIGRTDLKYSDKKMMYNSLCKLENVKFEKVYSGHDRPSDYNSQMTNIKVFKRFLTR